MKNLINTKNISINRCNSSTYKVYTLTFPDGTVYVGQSMIPRQRWANGRGYKNQREVYEKIQNCGWINVIKTIIDEYKTKQEALDKETEMIFLCGCEAINVRRDTRNEHNRDPKVFIDRTKTKHYCYDTPEYKALSAAQYDEELRRSDPYYKNLLFRDGEVVVFSDEDWSKLMTK